MADRREAAQKAWATRQAERRAAANPPVLLQAFLTSNEAIDQIIMSNSYIDALVYQKPQKQSNC